MDPITIAMGLAQFAPSIVKWVTGSDKAEEAAQTVVDIAKVVTGRDDADSALEAIKLDPNLALEFRKAVMANETELDRLYLADRQSARDRDAEFIKVGKVNYRADFMYYTAFAAVLGLVYIVWTTGGMDEYAKGVITLVLGRLLGYIDQVYSFEFGSTRNNRNKDDTINALSRK